MKDHPHLISLYNLYQNEVQSFRKVHRMIDLFESIIKSHTIVILGEYVRYNKLSDAAKGMLAQGLRTPSLGTWQLFSRVLFEELQAEDQFSWSFSEFPVEFLALDKCLNIEKTNIIAFRNSYAHGATPTDSQCLADIQKFEPFLNILLRSNWITTTRIETRESKVRIIGDSGEVCVHPILVNKSDGGDTPYAFFNDLKNDKVGLLNYPLSKHYREKDFLNEFYEYLPINEWKKSGNNEHHQHIEELTETFKGRTNEREKLLNFVSENNKGYCSIQGNPGIGKSALIAQFFKDMRAQKEITNVHVVEYFIRRGTIQSQNIEYMFNYLIRRTDEIFIQGKEIRAEGKDIWDLQQQLFAKWRLWGEQCAGKKLLLLIDGLDEGTENNIVKYLPRENFLGVLIIYGSRPGGHKSLKELWSQLPTENHTKLKLSGLSLEDIRALIYEVANKYELERESAWIDAVQKRSQGNPLYLKLLCDAIENGSIELNDIHALPEKIDDYYKAILARYAADTLDGDALLAGLYTFAAARDYLTLAHIKFINKLGDATVHRIGSTLKEVLYENPLTETVLDYQLFHESFREYLVKEKAREVSDAAERIIDFCSTWQDHEGNWELRYCLQHYAAHVAVSNRQVRKTELFALLSKTAYVETQKKILKQFDATKQFYQICLLTASEFNQTVKQLDAALCLIDLKYEEANDAPKVMALATSGNPDDLELALKRIESFGGADIEGVRRKFILYMLCLMELTLLGNKDAPFRKDTIDKLLKHLDEQIPVDNSIINWNEFFPSYTMFLMACEWAELGLNYLIIYKRTEDFDNEWVKQMGPYTDLQFDVWFKCVQVITEEYFKNSALMDISIELVKQGKIEQSIDCALEISRDIDKKITTDLKVLMDKIAALNKISNELAKHGKISEAAFIMGQSLEIAQSISFEFPKMMALNSISSELANQGKIKEAAFFIEQSIESCLSISNETMKSRALKNISSNLAIQGKFEQAHEFARGIGSESYKNSALEDISIELAKLGKFDESIECARGISSDNNKSSALKDISSELAKQGKMEQAIEIASTIFDDNYKSMALMDISIELVKQGNIEQAIEIAISIFDDVYKYRALENISIELAKQGKFEQAIKIVITKISERSKYSALMNISIELAKQGNIEQALEFARGKGSVGDNTNALKIISIELAKQGKMEQALECARNISTDDLNIDRGYYTTRKARVLNSISNELAKHGKIVEAASFMGQSLECAKGIGSESYKNSALEDISIELVKRGNIEQAIEIAITIFDEVYKYRALENISNKLAKQGKFEQAIEIVLTIFDKEYMYSAQKNISIEFAKQVKMEKALELARGIGDVSEKSSALKIISIEIAKQGKIKEATFVMNQAIEFASKISNEILRNRATKNISNKLAKQGMYEQAIECARSISNNIQKFGALMDIYNELAKQDKIEIAAFVIEQATFVIEQAIESALGIGDDINKSYALFEISSELAKQGKMDEATFFIEKAIEHAQISFDEWQKSYNLRKITFELIKQGKIERAIECARSISNDDDKSFATMDISKELFKNGNWGFAEKTGLEITQINKRQYCWKSIAGVNYEEVGWQKSLQQVTCFKTDEARMFYLKGWVEAVDLYEVNSDCVKEALSIIANDSESIETLLQKHALHEVFLSNTNTEKINQLNHSLNIQWMLDIANQFQNSNSKTRLSTNIETWLHEIADEDDRERLELWAMKVSKGTMNEEEFKLKLEKITFI